MKRRRITSLATARRRLRAEIADAERQCQQHARKWGACLSSCEQVQRSYWTSEALRIIGGKA